MCEELAYTKARMTLCVPIAIAQQMVYFFNIPHHYSRGSGAAVQHKLRKRASQLKYEKILGKRKSHSSQPGIINEHRHHRRRPPHCPYRALL